MALVSLEGGMLLLTRAPIWPRYRFKVAWAVEGRWWKRTLSSQQRTVYYLCKNRKKNYWYVSFFISTIQSLILSLYNSMISSSCFKRKFVSFFVSWISTRRYWIKTNPNASSNNPSTIHCDSRPYTVVLGADTLSGNEPTRQQFMVARAIPHPNYDGHENDIMLLKVWNTLNWGIPRCYRILSVVCFYPPLIPCRSSTAAPS